MLVACSGKNDMVEKANERISTVLPDVKNEVTTQILKKRNFAHELVSNGKVNARSKADLRFETGEVIARIYVKERRPCPSRTKAG